MCQCQDRFRSFAAPFARDDGSRAVLSDGLLLLVHDLADEAVDVLAALGLAQRRRRSRRVKPFIWLPSPLMGLTIHIGAQLHGEPKGGF